MTQLTLARLAHLDRVLRLLGDSHRERAIARDEAARRAALLPLLDGSPHGAVYLAGPERAPIGHVIIGFGWSVAGGGLSGVIDDIYLRPAVRGRGIGTELLQNLPKSLARAGLATIRIEMESDDARTRRLCEKAGLRPCAGQLRMMRRM